MFKQHIAENPKVPFEYKLKDLLTDDMQVIVKGIVIPKPKSFHVNFSCGSGSCVDKALHFKADFLEKTIALNSYRNKIWEAEEIIETFLLEEQTQFEINFSPRKCYFEIVINGSSLGRFGYRMPLEKITSVEVDGDLILSKLLVIAPSKEKGIKLQVTDSGFTSEAGSSETSLRSSPPPYPGPPTKYPIICNPVIPVIIQIDEGMSPGKCIFISGRPVRKPERFTINLKHGTTPYSLSDTAFHFDVRFKFGSDVRKVVCNSLIHGKWGVEEIPKQFPFAPGLDFDIIIKCLPDCFLVMISGAVFKVYAHRLYPLSGITALEISGDVFITLVTFQDE